MKKPENTFIGGVHKHLPMKLHKEKTNNPYRGGTPDCYYSGTLSELWIEYKFLAKAPVSADAKVDCSALQLEWLRGRYNEGRNVAVIVGCPDGGVILRDLAWEVPLSAQSFRDKLKSRQELAAWILSETGEPYDQERSSHIRSARRTASSGGRQAPNLR